MKKNILTIIIMAISLINTVLLGLLIFTIVPAANKTNQLVSKVSSIIDLELESPKNEKVAVSDMATYNIEEKLTITLKNSSADEVKHYAQLKVSLTTNTKSDNYDTLFPKVSENENAIKEIVTEEFSKYTIDEVDANKSVIKDQVISRIRELFQSDFILNVSFGNMVLN